MSICGRIRCCIAGKIDEHGVALYLRLQGSEQPHRRGGKGVNTSEICENIEKTRIHIAKHLYFFGDVHNVACVFCQG